MSPRTENVFEQHPARASLNGASASQSEPAEDTAARRTSVEDKPTQPASSPASGDARPAATAQSAIARGHAQRMSATTPGVSAATAEAVDPGARLLPDEVYPDSGARSRMTRSVRRLLQSEPERREAAVDRRLEQLSASAIPAGRLLVACSPKGGSGKTTVALGLSQMLAAMRWPTLVVDIDLTGGTAALHASGQRGSSGATVVDVLEALHAGSVRGPADLARYLTPLGGGATLLPGPPSRAERARIDVPQMERLLDALTRYWPVVVLDTSPGIGDRDEVQRWILGHASDIVAVAVPRRVDCVQARSALADLCALVPDTPITVALNQVPRRPDQPTKRVMSVPLAPDRNAHRVEIPHDPRLARQLDRAALELAKLTRPTRLAFKELAAALAGGWV